LAGLPEAAIEELIVLPEIRGRLAAGLRRTTRRRAALAGDRAVLRLAGPPALDAGEINDKGYINQRAVLTRRADEVARLYAEPGDPAVLVLLGR
jgi:feruloyl-CoA synthase